MGITPSIFDRLSWFLLCWKALDLLFAAVCSDNNNSLWLWSCKDARYPWSPETLVAPLLLLQRSLSLLLLLGLLLQAPLVLFVLFVVLLVDLSHLQLAFGFLLLLAVAGTSEAKCWLLVTLKLSLKEALLQK